MEEINRKMLVGTVWMLLARGVERGLGLISTLVLVRLLLPEDFGVVALSMSVIGFLQLMVAFGFDVVLIQNQNAEKYHYDTVWSVRVTIYSFVALVGFLLADYTGVYFSDDRVSDVVKCLCALILMSALVNVGMVDFRKQLNFRMVFLFSIAKKLISFLVTIPLAYFFRSYWALVIGILAARVLTLILSYFLHPYRPAWSLKALKEIFSMSGWIFVNNTLDFFSTSLPNFIGGRLSGVETVGYLSVTDEVVNTPTVEMVSAVNRATFPGYAKKQGDTEELKDSYLKIISFIAFLSIPAAFGIFGIVDLMISVVFGDGWEELKPFIQWISLASVFFSLSSNSGYINTAIGLPRLTTIISFSRLLFLVIFAYYLHHFNGVVGIVQAVFLSAFLSFSVSLIVQFKVLNITLVRYLSKVYRPFVASLMMLGAIVSLSPIIEGFGLIDFFNLFLLVLLGGISYLVSILLLWFLAGRPDGVENFVVSRAKKFFLDVRVKAKMAD